MERMNFIKIDDIVLLLVLIDGGNSVKKKREQKNEDIYEEQEEMQVDEVQSFGLHPESTLKLHQGLSFCGHDECEHLSNQKNYLELLHFLSRNNETIKRATFNEAPKFNKLTSPDIQKDITQAAAKKITNDRFKMIRENDWESLLEVSSFCIKHDIDILNIDDEYKFQDLIVLGDQLDTYISDLRGDDKFSGIEVIKLLLLQLVTTATVERVFSVMYIVKSILQNRR
ncbi:PREDICTED: uncharacterized protein LOC105114253 [Populus euphratica]|uniref:Uncharacterized protein LOC105114253 n=1 Tax=Populus euphratica TaxID=75702 RepID=A0AAJ6X898_POPEU|nr:PREDICTED: uncharacterized protein LOC105114253 [Populus euphratica]